MGRWQLWFLLLQTLMSHIDSKAAHVHLEKTIGNKPDVTPICTKETLKSIVFIICKIRTERSGEEECHLGYRHGFGFDHGCDSRFTLMTESQTVFLHLTSLTPVDSGNYTCECTHAGGTNILHLNITVEEDEDTSSSTRPHFNVIIGAIIFIVITGVILGVIYRKHRQGRRLEPVNGRPHTELQNPEPHLTFIQRENELYSSTIICSSFSAHNSNVYPDLRPL